MASEAVGTGSIPVGTTPPAREATLGGSDRVNPPLFQSTPPALQPMLERGNRQELVIGEQDGRVA